MDRTRSTKLSSFALFTAGAAFFAGSAIAQKDLPDAQIQANVMKAMANDARLANQSVNVSSTFGTVTLTGAVPDEASRTQAENIASHAQGVKKVIDQITIGQPSPDQAQAQQAPDDQTPPGEPGGPADPMYAQQGNGGPAYDPSAPPQDGSAPPPPGYNGQQAYNGQQGYDNGAPPPQPNGQQRLYRRQYEAQMQAQQGGYNNGDPNAQGYGQQGGPQGYGSQGPQGGYGPQGGPQGGYPPQQGYGQQGQFQGQMQAQPGGTNVSIPAGTPVSVRLDHWLSSKRVEAGTGFDGTVAADVVAGGQVAIPRGARVTGTVIDVHKAGAFAGKGTITLQLQSLTLGGRSYPLLSQPWVFEGRDKTGQTVGNTVVTGLFGALIGGAVGGGAGAAIGAGAGVAGGLGISAAQGGGNAVIPGEAKVTFSLAQPTDLVTVSQVEMQRLSYGAPGGPQGFAGGPGGPGYPPPPPGAGGVVVVGPGPYYARHPYWGPYYRRYYRY